MANKKISDLMAASAITGSELIEVEQSSTSKYTTPADLKTYMQSNLSLITSGTAQATTSGTSKDYTGIPSTAKRITIMLDGVSTNGTSYMQLQLGDSGGIEATGYSCQYGYTGAASNGFSASTGFVIYVDNAALTHSGIITLVLLDSSTNTWVCTGRLARSDSYGFYTAGSKSTSATLDRIRLTTVNGTDAFDAGKINILYE